MDNFERKDHSTRFMDPEPVFSITETQVRETLFDWKSTPQSLKLHTGHKHSGLLIAPFSKYFKVFNKKNCE